MTPFEQRKHALGEHLRQLREDAGHQTAKVFAEVLGWNAPKVSKIENGKQLPSDDDLAAWFTAANVTDGDAATVRAELEAAHTERVLWKQRVRAGYKARQDESIELEGRAKVLRCVEYGLVPGLLQTPDYARHVFLTVRSLLGGKDDIADAVRSRMRRQQVLYEPDKTLEFLVAEAALLHPVAPPDVMLGQIHRLIATIGTPNVRLGIIPARATMPFAPMHGYWILDQLVIVEAVTDEQRIHDPEQVQTYSTLTDRLWSVAVEGDGARAVLMRAADELQAVGHAAAE